MRGPFVDYAVAMHGAKLLQQTRVYIETKVCRLWVVFALWPVLCCMSSCGEYGWVGGVRTWYSTAQHIV
jgi:hypothetical protein